MCTGIRSPLSELRETTTTRTPTSDKVLLEYLVTTDRPAVRQPDWALPCAVTSINLRYEFGHRASEAASHPPRPASSWRAIFDSFKLKLLIGKFRQLMGHGHGRCASAQATQRSRWCHPGAPRSMWQSRPGGREPRDRDGATASATGTVPLTCHSAAGACRQGQWG